MGEILINAGAILTCIQAGAFIEFYLYFNEKFEINFYDLK